MRREVESFVVGEMKDIVDELGMPVNTYAQKIDVKAEDARAIRDVIIQRRLVGLLKMIDAEQERVSRNDGPVIG